MKMHAWTIMKLQFQKTRLPLATKTLLSKLVCMHGKMNRPVINEHIFVVDARRQNSQTCHEHAGFPQNR